MSKKTQRRLIAITTGISTVFGLIFPILQFFDISAENVQWPKLPDFTRLPAETGQSALVYIILGVIITGVGVIILENVIAVSKKREEDLSPVGTALVAVVGIAVFAVGLYGTTQLVLFALF